MTTQDRLWASAAIDAEIEAIRRCGKESANNPNSDWWRSVIRIASVMKGSGRHYIAPEHIRQRLHLHTPRHIRFKSGREKGINYLWGRAMNKAYPRYRVTPTPPYTGT